ncbi:MAG: 23S rRNA (adenine(2503)-C(2))-methyltransferase RlmN [Syntrophorhabdaceae bacterium]|nr:23S rRNA (adenine(2503)-C(2))-methyltransferase RlmN [Syntrophorhabdaceae bacterium]
MFENQINELDSIMFCFFGLTLKELEDVIAGTGKEKYRARQLYRWVYNKGIYDFSMMDNIPKSLRVLFSDMFDMETINLFESIASVDGSIKLSFHTKDGNIIESVLIPEKQRLTLCVSSQIGCRMACSFCVTGKIGFIRNLETHEIVEQIIGAKKFLNGSPESPWEKITNIVFMGMGEPLDNFENVMRAIEIMKEPLGLDFSKRRITVSTVGLLGGLKRLQPGTAGIAISLNAADEQKRTEIMPINRMYPIRDIMDFARHYKGSQRERITFEYVLLKGFNDSLEDAKMLYELLKGVRCKINLIPFNESPYSQFKTPDNKTVDQFHAYLIDKYMTAIVRNSRGPDVNAACGQLGMAYLVSKKTKAS